MYQVTTALRKLNLLKRKTRIIQGSQGAGKTISILIQLINGAQHNDFFEITIVQAELSKAKKTIVRDFLKILNGYGLFNRQAWNKSESTYTFPNGSYIEFIGLDSGDVGKGFRRDVVYFNELNKGGITLEAYMQFASRARLVFADFNPDKRFFVHDEIIPDEDTDFLILTFHDNEYLPLSEKKEILKYLEKGFYNTQLQGEALFAEQNIKQKYWANKWRVYGLGLVGHLDGVIFTDWYVIPRVPPGAKYMSSGLDFGFSSHPAALVDRYEYNGKTIYDLVIYRAGLTNADLARIIKGDNKLTRRIFADGAEPKSIEEIRRFGINIQAAKKGPGSVNYGIDLLQEDPFYVTATSKDLIFELENYTWMVTKDGTADIKPIKAHDHAIDSIRYDKVSTHRRYSGQYAFR